MQGRFKRDGTGSSQARKGRGEASAEQEPRAGTQHGSPAPQPQNPRKGEGGDGAARGTAADAATEHAPLPKLQSENSVGPRIALRNWRISTRLVALLTLPVVAATSLGGIRISESLQDMEQLDQMQLLTRLTKQATTFAEALQKERDLSAGPLANKKSASDYQVANPRKATDRAYKAFLDATNDIPAAEGDESLRSIRQNVSQIASQVSQLGSIRTTAYEEGVAHSVTVEAYSRLIRSLLSLSQDMAQATSNPEMIKRTRALAAFSSAKEYASIQQAIIASSLPPNDSRPGKIEQGDRLYGDAALTSEGVELKSFKSIYESTGGDAEELTATLSNGNPSIEAADNYAQRMLKSDRGLPGVKRGHLNFTDEYGTKMRAMQTIEATLLGEMETKARELRQESQRDAIINGALILLVLGVSLVGAFVVARSMIRSLRRLQDTATKVAQDRLPELVKQLSESDPQDVDTSVESVGVHSRDEIGQVAAAFDDVHREAVRLAAEQALLRGNVNAMFTNLSRRSQGLIQRQLSLISELESREADPDQLSSLFKLDHLATRMRRNGENLLVLAGEEPGRRWTRPVPLVDVLRAAASEVEQYERIELAAVPATEVAGRVVNDLVHLLAELLENATSFSSPQTKVRVTGHALPDGRVLVEIHDTGIGLSPRTSPRSTSGSPRRPPWTSRSPAAWVCSWSAACPCDTASGSSCVRPTRAAPPRSSCSRSTSPTAARSPRRRPARPVRAPSRRARVPGRPAHRWSRRWRSRCRRPSGRCPGRARRPASPPARTARRCPAVTAARRARTVRAARTSSRSAAPARLPPRPRVRRPSSCRPCRRTVSVPVPVPPAVSWAARRAPSRPVRTCGAARTTRPRAVRRVSGRRPRRVVSSRRSPARTGTATRVASCPAAVGSRSSSPPGRRPRAGATTRRSRSAGRSRR
ncbi:sensor histidine kinase [Streptomyces roseicoloratus]|uniref:sensor histidine kinase n=1 Tax=Streptomyces roseicoloratus TaxID=2508722 RepID=UPI0035A6972D